MTEASLPGGPVAVLVAPQMGENIGAAARALLNFGLERMRVVAPRDGWPNPRAVAMASGAGRLLETAGVFADTAAAVADLELVYATTARPREMTKRVLTPEAAMREAAAHTAAGARVGVLFGAERTGLANEDVLRAQAIVSVPVNPAFASLNLAQCVLLMAYEWRRAAEAAEGELLATGRTRLAPQADVARMVAHLVAALERAGFFHPPEKKASMQGNLENLFRRHALTEQEVRTLHGVIRALAGEPRRGPADPATAADMDAVRAGIDATDAALLDLLTRRGAFIARAAAVKAEAGLPARIPERVEQVVANARAGAAARGLDPALVERLWRMLIEAAIAQEDRLLGG